MTNVIVVVAGRMDSHKITRGEMLAQGAGDVIVDWACSIVNMGALTHRRGRGQVIAWAWPGLAVHKTRT